MNLDELDWQLAAGIDRDSLADEEFEDYLDELEMIDEREQAYFERKMVKLAQQFGEEDF